MIDFLESLAERQLQEYYEHWEGFYPETWVPRNAYAYRCYDRYERLVAVIMFLKNILGKNDDE